MILQGFVAGPRGQGEGNMLGHICGQGVLPRETNSRMQSTQLRLWPAATTDWLSGNTREEKDLQLRSNG